MDASVQPLLGLFGVAGVGMTAVPLLSSCCWLQVLEAAAAPCQLQACQGSCNEHIVAG
jgi:hypothetical protein